MFESRENVRLHNYKICSSAIVMSQQVTPILSEKYEPTALSDRFYKRCVTPDTTSRLIGPTLHPHFLLMVWPGKSRALKLNKLGIMLVGTRYRALMHDGCQTVSSRV